MSRETDLQRDLGDGLLTGEQQFLGALDPSFDQVGLPHLHTLHLLNGAPNPDSNKPRKKRRWTCNALIERRHVADCDLCRYKELRMVRN